MKPRLLYGRSRRPVNRLLVLMLILLSFIAISTFLTVHPTQAATNGTFSPATSIAGATCADSMMRVNLSFRGSTEDDSLLDYIVMVAYDGNGDVIASSNRAVVAIGTAFSAWLTPLNAVNAIAARPVKVVMYDTDYQAGLTTADNTQAQADYAEGFPTLAEYDFDPGTDANLAAVCASLPFGDGGAGSKSSKELPYTGIYLLPDAQQAPYLAIPAADGAAPCGVFDVNGWGRKYVGLADFPACTPPDLTVMCLNGDREWVADSVSDIYLRPDGAELDFTASQHGICAIFPTGSS